MQQKSTVIRSLRRHARAVTEYGETKCLCGLEVEHQLKFGGLFDWQVGRLFAAENTPLAAARLMSKYLNTAQ